MEISEQIIELMLHLQTCYEYFEQSEKMIESHFTKTFQKYTFNNFETDDFINGKEYNTINLRN